VLRRILLHIGGEKTGSTSVQAMLAMNRDALLAAGFAVPRTPGAANHIGLAAWAGEPALVPDLVAAIGGPERVAALPEALAAEVAALPPHAHTLLLSGEHCQSRLHDAAAIARLRDGLLAPLGAGEVQVLVYLRRQDGIALSSHGTWLRSHGALPSSPFPGDPASLALLDHAALLARWASVFGHDALAPRIYEVAAFTGGDMLRDVLAVCGVAGVARLRMPPRLNRSLAAPAQAFLAALTPAVAAATATRAPPDLTPLFALLERRFPGSGLRPARAEAAAFLARFAASNEAVRREYFPGRPHLFDLDLSAYPEQPDPPSSSEAVLAVAIEVMAALLAARPARAGGAPPPG
jgi:hypothetical protein